MNEKRRYIKLPPELSDGEHFTFHRKGDGWDPRVLGENLEDWIENASLGETIELTIVEMTDEEHEALPLI